MESSGYPFGAQAVPIASGSAIASASQQPQPAMPGLPAPNFHRHTASSARPAVSSVSPVPISAIQTAPRSDDGPLEPAKEDNAHSPSHGHSVNEPSSPSSPSSRNKPRAFRSLASVCRGMGRFLSVADENLQRNIDVQGIVQRIAVTLNSPETYKKVAENVFSKFSEDVLLPGGSIGRQLPLVNIKAVLDHWTIPEDHLHTFWAMLRKQADHWGVRTLPSHIGFEVFEATLVKVLRRIRDRYCDIKVNKDSFVTHNKRRLEEEYLTADACGKGSFGECTFVMHRMSKKKRVCKRIPKAEANVPSEEVEQELNTLRRLDHPNIVRVFEWFESDNAYLLVLEAAEGGDLKKLLASAAQDDRAQAAEEQTSRGLDESLVNTLMKQALKALIYIHQEFVIHRDIKPANMLLATADLEKPRLLLADFGVAELYQDYGKMQAHVRGTISYMAPEVFMNEVSPRADVWALGVVTFELLCGERPFIANNHMAMYNAVKTKPVNYDTVQNSGVSEQAVDFIKKTLNKDESSRPTAAEAIGDPWFQAHHDSLPQGHRELKKIRKSLVGYMSKSHFTKTAMNCIAAQLDTSRVEGLTDIFNSMDLDNNGHLSAAELAAGLAELGVDPDAIGQLVDSMDFNSDGTVNYSEFVASLLQTQGQLIEDVLYHAFHIFDINHDGGISLDELQCMLSGDGPLAAVLPDGKTAEQVLMEVDTSRDGTISFSEFKAYLLREGQSTTQAPEDDCQVDGFFDGSESLDVAFRKLAVELERPEDELDKQAQRLKDVHWLTTVGDLQELNPESWRRLALPIKLERKLRARLL